MPREPPALPGRLDPSYMATQIEAVHKAGPAAREELDDCIAQVGRTVGALRGGDA